MKMKIYRQTNLILTEPQQRETRKAAVLIGKGGIGERIARYARQCGFGIADDEYEPFAAISTASLSDALYAAFSAQCFERGIPVIHPFDMGWGTVVAVTATGSAPLSGIEIRTDNYDTDVRAYMGRYVSFWTHQTPAGLLQNNNPACSDALTLGMSMRILADLAAGKRVRLFPDMYFALCTPEQGV